MRKRSLARAFLLLLPLALSSCGSQEVSLSDYRRTLAFREGFSILQLSDIHWSFSTDRIREKAYLNALFNSAKENADSQTIDLVMITGDSTLLSNKEITKDLFDTVANWGVPFALTWGNHDRQGYYPFSWLEELVSSYPNSLYVSLEDTVPGNGNYVIDLLSGATTAWQIYALDSGSYQQSGTPLRYDYATLSDAQTSWYEKEANLANKCPSLAYFHIPTRDWLDVYEGKKDSKRKWEKNEGIYCSEKESSFFLSASEHNMKGLFCGHDHSNDLTMTYRGVVLGYGVKTGTELYYTTSSSRSYVSGGETHPLSLIGGSLVSLHSSGSFDLDHLYLQKDNPSTLVKERY